MRKILAAVGAAAALAGARDAAAICREVHEAGTPPPVMQPAQAVLVTHRVAQIGQTCPGQDAGVPDAGVPDIPPDAGPPVDAGPPPAIDAGVEPDPGCEPVYGVVTSMVVQPQFEIGADGASFALLMVTPSNPQLAVEDDDLFARLSDLTAPEVVVEQVTVEDESLGYQCQDPHYSGGYYHSESGGCGGGAYSPGGYGGFEDAGAWEGADAGTPSIETIGAYEVVRITGDRATLAGWLDTFHYAYTPADLDAVQPYLDLGWTVIAVRIATDHAHDGGLQPLALSWRGDQIRIPLGISHHPSPFHYPLTVYVAADDGRYDVGQGRVPYARRVQAPGAAGTQFLTRIDLDVDPMLDASSDPVAVQIGNVEYQDTVTVTQEVHIPSSDCPTGSSQHNYNYGCCDAGESGQVVGLLLIAPAVAIGLRRRRRC